MPDLEEETTYKPYESPELLPLSTQKEIERTRDETKEKSEEFEGWWGGGWKSPRYKKSVESPELLEDGTGWLTREELEASKESSRKLKTEAFKAAEKEAKRQEKLERQSLEGGLEGYSAWLQTTAGKSADETTRARKLDIAREFEAEKRTKRRETWAERKRYWDIASKGAGGIVKAFTPPGRPTVTRGELGGMGGVTLPPTPSQAYDVEGARNLLKASVNPSLLGFPSRPSYSVSDTPIARVAFGPTVISSGQGVTIGRDENWEPYDLPVTYVNPTVKRPETITKGSYLIESGTGQFRLAAISPTTNTELVLPVGPDRRLATQVASRGAR